jgi:hypothetical protein
VSGSARAQAAANLGWMRRALPLVVCCVALALPARVVAQEEPESLRSARRLAAELRYEEAVIEYQRYLAAGQGRPTAERARALLELGFLHRVLRDEPNASARAQQALELDPEFALPKEAPARQQQFLADARAQFRARPRLELLTGLDAAQPARVRASLQDEQGKVAQVWLRFAHRSDGPYQGVRMACAQGTCAATLRAPEKAMSFTAWYFVEAQDEEATTVARAGSPEAPQRLSVLQREPWHHSPWVWGPAGVLLVGAAAIVYLTAAPGR